MVIRVIVGSVYRITIYFVWIIVHIIRRKVCLNAREKHNVPLHAYFVVFMVRIIFGLKSHISAACLLQLKVAYKSWRIVLIMCFSGDITNNNTIFEYLLLAFENFKFSKIYIVCHWSVVRCVIVESISLERLLWLANGVTWCRDTIVVPIISKTT